MPKTTIEKTILCIDTVQMHKAMRKAVENGVSPEIAGNRSRFVRHLISEYVQPKDEQKASDNAGA